MAERYNFKYLPLVGKLPGKSMVEQTETAINELASVVYDNVGDVGNLAEEVQTANTNASNALGKATEALETSGRVYIKLIAAVDVNDYYDSELYYINNDGSTNIPVRDRGFLEVKTNDDKTACEQVFIADSTGTPYYRHGVITEQTLGEETTYVVTWGSWYRVATTEYVQAELQDYLPLSGGTVTGDLFVTGTITGIDITGNVTGTASGNLALSGGSIKGDVDITGDLSVSGTITGDLVGNADTATNATNDANGNPIASTYLPAVVGVVQAFAGRTTPQGWLLCDGSAVSRTDYAALYAVIGTTYGAGNGSTTFNLPNLVDKFVEGSATAGTVKSAGLPNITGTAHALLGPNSRIAWDTKDPSIGLTGPFYATGKYGNYASGQTTSGEKNLPQNLNFDASRSNPIYGKSTTVQPPALTMRYIIKY